MKVTNQIQDFMALVPWKELEVEDKQALMYALKAESSDNYGLFEVQEDGNGNGGSVVLCEYYEAALRIDSSEKRKAFVGWIENAYMYGEDGETYIDWLRMMDEEDDFSIDFAFSTDSLKALSDIDNLPDDTKNILYRLLYANAIMYLEAYLNKKAKEIAFHSDKSIRKFVENCKDFSEKKLNLQDIYRRLEALESEIKEYLDSLLYHNLFKIKALYFECFEIDLGELKELSKKVAKRHDIVHRNGKTKEGNDLNISKADVEQIWKEVKDLVERIESQLKNA